MEKIRCKDTCLKINPKESDGQNYGEKAFENVLSSLFLNISGKQNIFISPVIKLLISYNSMALRGYVKSFVPIVNNHNMYNIVNMHRFNALLMTPIMFFMNL